LNETLDLPTHVLIPRKTKKARRITMNLNVYRNTHYHVLNQAKKIFKEDIGQQLRGLPIYGKNLKLKYVIYLHRKGDIMNVGSIVDKFFCDALIDYGKIKDDNCEYITEVTVKYGGIDKERPRAEVTIYG